jgi:NAD(P)-dependent dehydrogenase (short-subunit alcohol dehydrogenase family)
MTVRADVSKSADVATMLAAVEHGLSPIDIFVNNAGRLRISAAKAGVIALTKSYARLLAKEGITVNAIAPALIATEMVRANPNITPDMIPVGRFGEVEECANVAVLLVGNGYITEQTIGVSGGLAM